MAQFGGRNRAPAPSNTCSLWTAVASAARHRFRTHGQGQSAVALRLPAQAKIFPRKSGACVELRPNLVGRDSVEPHFERSEASGASIFLARAGPEMLAALAPPSSAIRARQSLAPPDPTIVKFKLGHYRVFRCSRAATGATVLEGGSWRAATTCSRPAGELEWVEHYQEQCRGAPARPARDRAHAPEGAQPSSAAGLRGVLGPWIQGLAAGHRGPHAGFTESEV